MNTLKLVKPCVRALRAYEAKEIPCRVKLDANESPYTASDALLRGISKRLRNTPLNRYPDPEGKKLKAVLAKRHRVRSDHLLLGNGSDELIALLVTTFGGPVLYPVPTFSMYGIIARGLGERTVEVRLDKAYDLDVGRMQTAIRKHRPKIVFLSSPNNPTGNSFSPDRILEILAHSPGVVVVDEAYGPFSSSRSFVSRLRDHRNLVVLHTLSKIGLAALRVGYMVTSREITSEVNKVRLPFNVNALSQAVAEEALSKHGGIEDDIVRIMEERKRLADGMSRVPGIRVLPSDANFIMFQVPEPVSVYRQLLRDGVLVRNLHPAIPGSLRVTVGRPGENRAFLRAIRKVRL